MKVGTIYRKQLVTTIKNGVDEKENTFLVSYRGISASKMNILRKDLSKKAAKMRVTKAKIAGLALKELKLDDLSGRIDGQTALIYSDSDAVEISKILVKFSKQCEGFVVQGGLVGEVVLDKKDVQRFSDLPSREVLLSQLLSLLQSPATKLAYILNAKSRDMLSILKQYSEKKGGS